MVLDLPERPFGGYIFDCDGTLADTMPLHYRAWVRLAAEQGRGFSEEFFYGLGGKPTHQILELLRDHHGFDIVDIPAAAARKERYFVESIGAVRPIEAVVQIARRLHSSAPLAVASGGMREFVELTLDVIGVRALFDVVVCVEDVARAKPWPDPFLEAARRMNVPPAECLVFEDSPLGLQAAHAAGMQGVFVPRSQPAIDPAPFDELAGG